MKSSTIRRSTLSKEQDNELIKEYNLEDSSSETIEEDKTNKSHEISEIVVQDLEPGFIGTKRSANDISYNVRKLYPLIVEFEDII